MAYHRVDTKKENEETWVEFRGLCDAFLRKERAILMKENRFKQKIERRKKTSSIRPKLFRTVRNGKTTEELKNCKNNGKALEQQNRKMRINYGKDSDPLAIISLLVKRALRRFSWTAGRKFKIEKYAFRRSRTIPIIRQ